MKQRAKRILLVLAGLAALLAVAAYAVLQLPPFGGDFEGERLERMKRSPEYVGDRFENDPPQNTEMAPLKELKAYLGDEVREPQFPVPVVPLDPADLRGPADPDLSAIWFGHATVLVEIEGVRFLTDPVLSERASPFAVGPRRFHPPPIPLADLSGIDGVVISHDHYDHLDMRTVEHLAGQGTNFYVGLGIGAHLERWGVPASAVHEMDWWETAQLKGVTVHCTPARHYSGRKRMDNSTLWASWAVRGARRSFYYSGDTGYAPHFAEIRRRLGETDLALIKVGAYGDTWLDIHMDPESAVRAHRDLGAAVLLPVHWATFNLAYHAWEEPIVRTLAAAREQGATVAAPRLGERVRYGQPFANTEWYLGR